MKYRKLRNMPGKSIFSIVILFLYLVLIHGPVYGQKEIHNIPDENGRLLPGMKIEFVKSQFGDQRNSIVYFFDINPDEGADVDFQNIRVVSEYNHSEGKLKGHIDGMKTRIMPGGKKLRAEITVVFPQNWTLRFANSSGRVDLLVFKLGAEEQVLAVHQQPISMIIPTSRLLYLLITLAILAVIGYPLALVYQLKVPIEITLKSEGKAAAYQMYHKGKITIGKNADFVIPEAEKPVAELQRRFRRFVIVEQEEGVIPESYGPVMGKLPVKLGHRFRLNIGGRSREFIVLPGNQEKPPEIPEMKPELITDEDLDEGPEELKL